MVKVFLNVDATALWLILESLFGHTCAITVFDSSKFFRTFESGLE